MSLLNVEMKPKTFFTGLGAAILIAAIAFGSGLWAGKSEAAEAPATTVQPLHEVLEDQPQGTAIMVANVSGKKTCDVYVPADAKLTAKFKASLQKWGCKLKPPYFTHDGDKKNEEDKAASEPPPVTTAAK